ncbi:RNA polymerase sigma factor [Thermodesulfobacteriota bacterium]
MNKSIDKKENFKESDAEIVRDFQGGNKLAFDKLVIRHENRIFNLCYSFLKDYEESNDCAQDIFIKAFRSLKNFKFKSAFSTWLYRVAVNTCKNRLRSSDFKHKKLLLRSDNPGKYENGYSHEFEDKTQSPMHDLEIKEKRMHIRKALDSLPSKLKTIIILRDIQGFSYDEIAKITRLNQGTVKSRISRARSGLRKKLRSVI